ncbi:nuclear RNA export factor 1 [Passer montanus]|uniref:nuclear RNA export factor 1 n=1 Tax=Passer montanus TaxID=9160 RepID=UPI0019616BB2|nr:nuclear RNA export factor 1 [Passer montanus]
MAMGGGGCGDCACARAPAGGSDVRETRGGEAAAAAAMAEEGKGGGYSEHDDRVGGRAFPVRRRKGRGPFRGKMYSEGTPRGRPRRARPDDDDGDVPMAEAHDGPRGRYVPYAPRSGRLANINITVKREPGERGGGAGRDGGRRSWFKITFHYDHNRAQFYVEDATTASALKQVSRKITDRDNYKGVVCPCGALALPGRAQLCMSKRYDGSQKSLDLKSLRVDPDLVAQSIEVVLSQRGSMGAVLRIIEENIPEIAFDVEAPTTLPPCKGSYFGSDDLKALVLRFLQQYYSVYDSSDRQGLLDAYHDGACCSLSIPYGPHTPPRNSLNEYFKDSRNVKKLKDPTMRFKLLKHTRLNVVAFLNELPKTQHDVNSFVVDICAQTNTLLCFTVHGIFKEVDGKSRDSVRAFTRMFIAVPAGNSG